MDKNGNQRWCMIELYSKIYPEQWQVHHISVKELYIGVQAMYDGKCIYWDHYFYGIRITRI